jgi:excisionase family DNA binding protein
VDGVYFERMTSDQTLLTTREAAEQFEVSPGTVRRWIREGQIPAVTHPSGRRRVRRSDVEAILRAKNDTSASTGTAA